MENNTRKILFDLLAGKLERFSIRPDELKGHFDLVKSGLVNSLEFVEIVSAFEKAANCEIDFESAIEKGDLTTIEGLMNAIEKAKHDRA